MTSSSSFAVRRTNTGLGLFTLQPIRAGKRIIEYLGPIVTNEVVRKSRGQYFFGIDETCAIDGRARSNVARYINHSCQPCRGRYRHFVQSLSKPARHSFDFSC